MNDQQRQQATGGPCAPINTKTTTTTSIDRLNNDVLGKIFEHLHYDDKIRLRRTCRKWRHLLDGQTRRMRALRLGQFWQGGYQVTSSLAMRCDEHQAGARRQFHRQETGTLMSEKIFQPHADLETHCHTVAHYDYLHRALKHSHENICMLSLGRVHISYRLITALATNLPRLEHLELIACATEYDKPRAHTARDQQSPRRESSQAQAQTLSISGDDELSQVRASINSSVMYNQHQDEQVNVRERLLRSTFIKNCSLIQEARTRNLWPAMRHLLVKECNLMNEFTLSLLLALTSHSLAQLEVDKNQFLTGEFLNYCGPHLRALKIQHCPSIRGHFIDDLLRIRKLLGSQVQVCDVISRGPHSLSSSLKFTTSDTNGRAALALAADARGFFSFATSALQGSPRLAILFSA